MKWKNGGKSIVVVVDCSRLCFLRNCYLTLVPFPCMITTQTLHMAPEWLPVNAFQVATLMS